MATSKTMSVKILNVCKTTSEWASVTDKISKGLLCVEFTTDGKVKIKIGDGTKTFANLPYVQDGAFSISDYYTKTETTAEITSAINKLGNVVTVKGVKATTTDLPTSGNKVGDIWFVGTNDSTTDSFTEYIWTTNSQWEYLGKVQTEVDLSEYAKTADVTATVKAVTDRVDTLESKAHTHANQDVLDATTASYTTADATKLSGIAEGATKITVDSALSSTSTNPVENKAVNTALGKKVDKVTGKGLSTNDYTTDEKNKLAGIEEGANKTTVDSALSKTSTNPVENKAVATAIETLNAASHTHSNKSVLDATTASYTVAEQTKLESLENYDDTALAARVKTIEDDYITSTDTLVLNCTL